MSCLRRRNCSTMWAGIPNHLFLFCIVFLSSGHFNLLPLTSAQNVPKVTSVSPREGGSNGGTRITIYGEHFAETLFALTDADKIGNKVTLSSLKPYPCDIHPDGTHGAQITCYTTPMEEGTYDIKVSVNGEDILDANICSSCTFTVKSDRTPTITSVDPPSGIPGQVIKLSGDLRTYKYGSNIPDDTQAKILRVYFGGQKCELRKSIDEMYGLEYSEDSHKGYMMCKTEGTFIWNQNISYLVSNEYGRSKASGYTKHPRANGISMYQTFTEMTNITLNQGSIAGGTHITISGKHLDETRQNAKIRIAGSECVISGEVTDDSITCVTQADPTNGDTHFTGGRGFHAYVQSGILDASTINKNTTPADHLDVSEWRGFNLTDHTVLMAGFFVPVAAGNYSFCLNAASSAKLFIDENGDPASKTMVYQGTSSCKGPYNLEKDQRCYIEVHYSSSEIDSYVTVKSFVKETTYSESDTSWAQHETQKFTIKGRTDPEIQKVEPTPQGNVALVPDVQKITIAGDGSSTFVIGLDGVYTTALSLPSLTADVLEEELAKLPSVVGDVAVTVTGSDPSKDITITSSFEHGMIGSYDGLLLTGSDGSLTFTYSRPVIGSGASTHFALTMNYTSTDPIMVGSSSSKVEKALLRLFSVQCHPKLDEGKVEEFESRQSWMREVVSDTEPFCGRYSIKNPYLVFKESTSSKLRLSATGNRYVCFAYKGPGGLNRLLIKYENFDNDGESSTKYQSIYINNPDEDLTKWNYWCEDIYTNLRTKTPGTLQIVNFIRADRKDTSLDMYMDQFAFRKDTPISPALYGKIGIWRRPQVQPQGYFIDSVDVTKTGGAYDISLKPHHCGHDFDLFEVSYGNVTRVQEASIPIVGTYTISFKGDTTDEIPVTVEADPEGVAALLAASKVGFSEVKGSGTCSGFSYEIKMVSQTGEQPEISLDISKLSGDSVTSSVKVVKEGGLWLSPIMGDLLRTHHTSPQVLAYINGIPTRCAQGAVCDFVWSQDSTPIVTSVTPSSGSNGNTVTISGSGFGDNVVTFGDTPCIVTSSTSTSIVCTVQNGPTGPARVKVNVEDKGFASGNVTFTFVTGVPSFPTLTGSLEGGTNMAFSGYGFSSDAEVTVDGNICTIVNTSESNIECITPRAASLSTTSVDVKITQAGSELTLGTFTYSLAATPIIASINVTSSSVSGGDAIAILGSGFGVVEMPVMLGDTPMEVVSYADNKIIAVLPAMGNGDYRVKVKVDGKGYADLRTNSISDVSYIFKVNYVYPDFGSMFGGTELSIQGAGFQNDDLQVHVGQHECDVMSVDNSNIRCRIQDTGVNHHVFSNGTHKSYGVGYAWNKDPLTVKVGDTVTWHWETPFYVSDIAYSVRQTAKANDLVDMPGGFSSGPNNRKGTFSYTFTTVGTFHYWTNYLDSSSSLYFRGTLHIVPLESTSQPISVKMHGSEAAYDTSASGTPPSPTCPEVTSNITGCVDDVVTVPESGKFTFKFSKCYSPRVTGQTATSGSFYDSITLQGEGFGSQNCQNVIYYGLEQEKKEDCTQVVSSSSASVDFKIIPSCQPPVGELHQFRLRVGNLGYALTSLAPASSRFGLVPIVQDIQPAAGSKVGGTKITITGAGFTGDIDNIIVEFQRLSCEIESMNYTHIVCTTKCSSSPTPCFVGQMPFSVTVGTITASCDITVCQYNTTEEETPVVDSVSPNTVSSATTQLQFSGSKFSSKMSVLIGDVECVISGAISDTSFTCQVGRLPVGPNSISVYVDPLGKAFTTEVITSQKIGAISSPSESGLNGGASLVVDGNGFVEGDTNVKVGGKDCIGKVVTLSQVTCLLPAQAAGTHDVVITSNGHTYDSLALNYTSQSTPVVQSIAPNSGKNSDQVVVTGQGFDAPSISSLKVKIGGVDCIVTASTTTTITCNAGVQSTGQFDVQVFVQEKGLSNANIQFTYELSPFTVSPIKGSTNGGQTITLTGSGFLANETEVTACGKVCQEVSASSAQYVCKTTSHAAAICDVVAEVRGVSQTTNGAYTYDATLLSTVTSVNPKRGGTGGGTLITIQGTNFGTIKSDITVMVAESECDVQSVTNTQIECRVGSSNKSVVTEVEVQRSEWGLAQQIDATFEYIDVWSSRFTWGGKHAPAQDEFIIIPKGKKILLDVDTPVLEMLLIQGGHLVFDEKDIELQSKYILITDGGILEVGTEEKPFEHKGIITLHGHVRSKELPVYGAKGIGLREGMLELHGQPITVPWTYLSATATVGATTIVLEQQVNWKVGDEIIIATTGDRFSQKESEVREIATISADKMHLTLTKPLQYEHISQSATFGSRTVEFKAEVGLLTRNVVVRGYRNVEFDHSVEACPDGFNPGEFATQTCFQGRFGEEVGSDQYGVHILIHQQDKDTQVAQAHIENTEITHAGQAFRLGRYPVHFHLNGNMSQSYVRRCAIHHTFNRAVNIHGSHHTMVEHNVVYNVMGGALFLEDGDETGNTFQYNLEIFIKSSTSLLNDDITPAAIWATNPYNYIRHNAAAGGTHFGVWYRMHSHPDGPGFTSAICPQNVPLGEYSNNTAHSLGWFGLWIFETYVPKDSMVCSNTAPHKVAKFYSLTAWNNNEGAEAVNAGAIQFHDFVVVNNQKSGIHFSLITGNPPQYDPDNGPGVFSSLIVARHGTLKGLSSGAGIVQPHFNGFMVKDVEFHNFDQSRSIVFTWVTIAGVCVSQCGGFTTAASGLTFVNSPNRVRFAWENEGVIKDLDGSLTGSVGGNAVACSGSFDPSKCTKNNFLSKGVDGCVCTKDIKLVRFAFNNIQPESLLYKTAHFTSKHGITKGPWIEKRITHKKGWQVVLMANTSYDFSFENAGKAVNISYFGTMYSFSDGDYIILTQNAYQRPDMFQLYDSTQLPMSSTIPAGDSVADGDWFYNDTDVTYAIKPQDNEKSFNLRVTRCFYRGCEKPASPMSILAEPKNAEYTSILDTWKNITVHGNPPRPLDDIFVAYDRWIVVDTVLPKLGKVVIEGGLQFSENFTQPNLLEADHVYIKGRLVAGWSEDKAFNGQLTIRLRGNHSSPNYPVTDGPNLGSKFIAVFGGLQLHGTQRSVTKTFLAIDANTADSQITVKDAVDWKTGDEILISTTDYDAWHTEVFKLTSVAGKTLGLNGTIKHRHISHQETVNGKVLELSANVALLTRNIRVEGAEYDDLIAESFGARIVVGQTFSNDEMFSGFAQISNVEFFHAGQEGFTSNYDARYALTYMGATSSPDDVRYSYVRHNTFHNGFSPAIGVFGTDGLEIDDNTIHHTVGAGIHIETAGAKVMNNLVTLSIWPGSYLDRQETQNYDFNGGIFGRKATDLVLVNNTVAGSERSGYGLPGQSCDTRMEDLWTGNMAMGTQTGVSLFMVDTPADSACTQFSGFILWKNFDYGIYYNNKPSAVIKNNVFIENSIGVTPFVVGPGAVSHSYANKSCLIEDNVFIGKTSKFSESLDVIPSTDSVQMSGQSRGQHSSLTCGKVGIMGATFTSGSNEAPRKPWLAIMSYQAINGITIVRGNQFINYGPCTGGRDHAIATNMNNDDVIHPLIVSESTLTNVQKAAKILFHVPNVGKINPSDCVDMDCDGHKKCLITDTDGTFLGSPGTVLPEAAYEWDGDRRHGLGDYRIPTPMLATPSGGKKDPDVIAPHKGLYKIDECTWINEWVAYECHNGLQWRMLVAESMDSDTEMRRISPVAVYHPDGYVDLVNGPQDHGWCSGYTCQKRLSTFPILVALGQPYELFLTGTNPKVMRFMLLNSNPSECIRLSMWFNVINRLEVSSDGQFVKPNNGFYDTKGRYRVKLEETKGQYMPKVSNMTSTGENYVSQEDQIVTWVVCGGSEVKVTRTDALLVSFTLPEITVDDFFGENLVENLAGFLEIDPKKVRIVDVISSNPSARRKRSTDTTTVYVEISDGPGEAPSTDISEVNDHILTLAQFGSVSEVLQVEVLYTAIVDPESESDELIVVKKPGSLVMHIPPEGFVSEDTPLSTQPRLKVVDVNGDVVSHLGSSTLVWEIEASIKSGGISRSAVVGTKRLNFTGGWANFTDLAINDKGTDYVIEFRIVYPPEAVNFTIESRNIHIFGKNLGPKATVLTSRRITDTPIQLEVGLVDKDTGLDFTNIGWDNHTWEAELSIYDTTVYSGALSGVTKTSFDPATGKGTFSNILLDAPGKCPLLVTIKSDPAGYLLKMVVTVDLITPDQDTMLVEVSTEMEFKFPITFDKERAPFWADQVANAYSKKPGFKITGVTSRPGSIYVSLSIEASKSGYNETLTAMCGDIESGRNFTFDGTTVIMSPVLNIGGKPYYGVSCGPISDSDDGDEFDVRYIIIIVLLALIILILLAVVVYKCYVQPKAKTSALTTTNPTPVVGNYYKDRDLLNDVLLREESSSSFKSWTTSTKAPNATVYPKSQTPFDLRLQSPEVPPHRTPSPAWN